MIPSPSNNQDSDTEQAVDIADIGISNVNVVVHGFGLYLLSSITTKDVQHWLLIGLSASEVLKNILTQITTFPDVLNDANVDLDVLNDVAEDLDTQLNIYIKFFNDYGVTALSYVSMFFITLEPLLKIKLSDYSKHCNEKRVKYLLLATGLCSLIIPTALAGAYHANGGEAGKIIEFFSIDENSDSEFVVYAQPCLDILFVLLSMVTYYNIFRNNMRSQNKLSSQALTSVLLALSFILFTVVPDLTSSYYEISEVEIPYSLEKARDLIFKFNDLASAVIYIFTQDTVRNMMSQKLGLQRLCGASNNR